MDLRGKFVLLSYWSTICGWAVSEIPFLDDLYEKHRAHGLEIVGLMDEDQPAQVREFVEKNRVKWPNAIVPDLGTEAVPLLRDAYPVVARLQRPNHLARPQGRTAPARRGA